MERLLALTEMNTIQMKKIRTGWKELSKYAYYYKYLQCKCLLMLDVCICLLTLSHKQICLARTQQTMGLNR